MKKIVAVTAFFLAFQINIFAQYGDLRLGFQISPMVSFLATDDNTINGNGANLGLKLGMMGEYYFRENYAFIGGLGFSFNSGGTLRYESFSETWQKSDLPANVTAPFPGGTELKYNLQYVEIPFGLKFRTKEFGYFRYYVEIPVFTLGFNSQARGAISYTNVNEDKIDIKDEVIGISFSWGMGGGFEYGLSESTALVGGISFQQLFTDVSKNYKPGVDTKTQITHIVLRLGVMF